MRLSVDDASSLELNHDEVDTDAKGVAKLKARWAKVAASPTAPRPAESV